MDKKLSNDPRSVRARQALYQALKYLLAKKPFDKITVTDIAREAGLARHTFYNHYETKEELLYSFIDAILDELFTGVGSWNSLVVDPEGDYKVGERMFQIWQDHAETVKILNSVDIDRLLIDRFKAYLTEYYHQYANQDATGVSNEMAQYLIHFNAYSFVGILRQWFRDDMRYPPELMGQFLSHFAGIGPANAAIQRFKGDF